MFDIFGLKAKHTLYELGRNMAMSHVKTLHAYIIANATADHPQTLKMPLSVVLGYSFTQEPGVEWKHPSFVKGFKQTMQGMCTHDAVIRHVRSPHQTYVLARGKCVPHALLHMQLEVVQTHAQKMLPEPEPDPPAPPPEPTEPSALLADGKVVALKNYRRTR